VTDVPKDPLGRFGQVISDALAEEDDSALACAFRDFTNNLDSEGGHCREIVTNQQALPYRESPTWSITETRRDSESLVSISSQALVCL
jgi:hypothetical protein